MAMEIEPLNLPDELNQRREIILRELRRRTLWFIQLRWLVPPAIIGGSAAAWIMGVEFARGPVIATALYVLAYNAAFYFLSNRRQAGAGWTTMSIKRFTYLQVSLDYTTMFLLIHFTGGAASPFIFFFIFHVIFAAILLPPRSAYGFAALAAAGMAGIAAAEYSHWLSPHPLIFLGQKVDLAEQPFHVAVELCFFAASVFITAFATTSLMPTFRTRIHNLVELSEAVVRLNDRLNALYQITQSITSTNRFEQVLALVTSELTRIMKVQGIAIKLLSEDRQQLTYAAVHGLSLDFIRQRVVEVAKSPLNRRILEGEPFAIGDVSKPEMFQFSENLAAVGIKSVLSTPLMVEGRVIGILSAYAPERDFFGVDEVDFFRLAAGLAAVALENARFFEAIEKLVKERSWFMMRVAHHLRAPLSGIRSILNTMLEGFLGEFAPEQMNYLQRINHRAEAMMKMVGELMTLSESRNQERVAAHRSVDLGKIAANIRDSFLPEAESKGLAFNLTVAPDFPEIQGDPEMLEQLIENFVSNALKYTDRGGRVDLEFAREEKDQVRLKFADTGIGIPQEDMPRLFTEFFRSENAKKMEEVGAGLGLAIVKDIIQQHHGRITVDSKPNQGTTFTVFLPLA